MVVALNNVANASVQKNDTVAQLVIANLSLYASLTARGTEIARLLTVITNLSTGGGVGGGAGVGPTTAKSQAHPGTQ